MWAVTFAPDGKTALTGSYDGTAYLWDVATGQARRRFTGHLAAISSVAFAPDGKTFVTGSWDRTVRLWDVATSEQLSRFIGHTDVVSSVAFAPDGQSVLSTSSDGTVRLWAIISSQPIRIITESTSSAVFAPDGKAILTDSPNGARWWAIDYRDSITLACTHISLDFRDSERAQFALSDPRPTCPQFGPPRTAMPSTTAIPGIILPVWTPIASSTITDTSVPSMTPDPTSTPTYPGILLTFTPSATNTP